MDLLQLQYFRTIAHLENLTKASQLLFVTQPNLSTSITRLEEDLGVSLFNRRKGRIVLTPTGKIFLEYVNRILNDLDEGIERVRADVSTAKNHIRVACSITDIMNDIFLKYYSNDNNFYFKHINCPNSEVFDKVLSGEVDVGFVFGTPKSSDLEHIVMDSCERVVVLHEDHPLAKEESIYLSQLTNEKFICNREKDDDVFLKELATLQGFHPNICFECNDTQMEINLLLYKHGICISPLTNYIAKMRISPPLPLKCIRIKDQLPESQIGMVRRKNCMLSEAAFEFYRHVAEFLKGENEKTKNYNKTTAANS